MIDFGLILRLIWGPKSIQNEVGNRVGKVIGKGRAKDGLIGANLGSKMGSCWAENRRRLESKKQNGKEGKGRSLGFHKKEEVIKRVVRQCNESLNRSMGLVLLHLGVSLDFLTHSGQTVATVGGEVLGNAYVG